MDNILNILVKTFTSSNIHPIYYNLVIESRVTNLNGTSQKHKASYLFRETLIPQIKGREMAYWNTGYGYRQSAWSAPQTTTECGRCGMWYRLDHQCMALTRRCLFVNATALYQVCQQRRDAHWNTAGV